MMTATTKQSLGIFWDGEEMDGFLVYALWWREVTEPPTIPLDSWPRGTEAKTTRLFGDGWTVWMWEVRIEQWPNEDQWPTLLTEMLNAILAEDAVVSWAGLEGMFVEPPGLFEPAEMSGGVWAVALSSGKVLGPPPLEKEFEAIDDSALAGIRREVFAAERV